MSDAPGARFSARSAFLRHTNRFSALLAERRERGARILDLTASNPTRAGFRHPGPALLSALADPLALDYDPRPEGRQQAREAVARYYADQGQEVDPARIFLTASTSEAYGWLFKLLCDPGDAVLLPQPSYPLVDFLAALEGVALQRYPLEYHGRWAFDLPALESALGGASLPSRPTATAAAAARAILLVSPNNPTGNIATSGELGALDTLAARHSVAVIADEVFADFPFADSSAATPPPVAALAAREALTFTLSGISKVCGLPQLKLGWILIGGPEAAAAEAAARLEIIADSYLSVGTPVQVALPRLLAGRHAFQHECRERIRGNRAIVARHVAAAPRVELLGAEAGWYACLRVPRTRPEEELVIELLAEDGVAVHPGYFFDFPEEAYLVLSLIVKPSELETALGHILSRV